MDGYGRMDLVCKTERSRMIDALRLHKYMLGAWTHHQTMLLMKDTHMVLRSMTKVRLTCGQNLICILHDILPVNCAIGRSSNA